MECVLAAGVKKRIKTNAGKALADLESFRREHKGWLFGHLGYALKNEIEDLERSAVDRVGFPDLYFFEPEVLVRLSEGEMIIEADDAGGVFRQIDQAEIGPAKNPAGQISIQNTFTKEGYIESINKFSTAPDGKLSSRVQLPALMPTPRSL